jgi:hypothetical protein
LNKDHSGIVSFFIADVLLLKLFLNKIFKNENVFIKNKENDIFSHIVPARERLKKFEQKKEEPFTSS